MLESLVNKEPIEAAETFAELSGPVPPQEFDTSRSFSPRRRDEFLSGRICARRAAKRLGIDLGPIPVGPDRAPQWPVGIVGSITHCAGYRGAAVAYQRDIWTLGIDAEPTRPLPEEIVDSVLTTEERARSTDAVVADLNLLIFSAKEAVFKAWWPVTGRWLDFHDVTILIEEGTFRCELVMDDPLRHHFCAGQGRWVQFGGLTGTMFLLRPPSPESIVPHATGRPR